MDNQVVVFELGSEQFGVNITAVESIIKMQPITSMPHAPSFVEGVTNLRGKILPVIDLHKRFGLMAQEASKKSRIMVINVKQTEIGMIVDGVSEVLTLPDQSVEPPHEIVMTADSAFVTGIAKVGERLIILLDINKVLSEDEKESLVL